MNKITVTGHLTADPTCGLTSSGVMISNFTVAVNRRTKDNAVDFFKVVTFNKLAEICMDFLKKGSHVLIDGECRLSDFTGKNGERKYRTEIIANTMEILSRKKDDAEKEQQTVAF